MAIGEEIEQEFQEEPAPQMEAPVEEQPIEEEVQTEEVVVEEKDGGTGQKKQPQPKVQILSGKGGKKTVVSAEPQSKQPVGQPPVKTLSKDADSPRSNLPYVLNPAKTPSTFQEIVVEDIKKGEEERPEIERKASIYGKYESNQRAKIDIQRKIDKKQKEIDSEYNKDGTLKSQGSQRVNYDYGGGQSFADATQQIKNWKPGLDFWSAESKKSLDATNKELEKEVTQLFEENKNNYKGSPGLVKESQGGVLTTDMGAVQDIAKRTAKKYGVAEDGYFYSLLKTKLAAYADFNIDVKKAKEDADKEYQRIYGKQSQKEAVAIAEGQENVIKIGKNELKSLATEIQGFKTEAQKGLEDIYTKAVNGVNEEVNKMPEVEKFRNDTVKNAFAELQTRVNNGEISYNDAVALSKSEEFADALNKKIETFINDNYGQMYTGAFEQYMRDLNTVNTKYDNMYKNREAEVIRMADKSIEELTQKAKNLDATSVENYKKIYAKSYENARKRRKGEEKYAASTLDMLGSGLISSFGAAMRGYGSSFGIKALEDFGEELSANFSVPEWSIEKASDLLNPRAVAGSFSSVAGRAIPGILTSVGVALATRNASLTVQYISAALTEFAVDTLDQYGTMKADVFAATGDIEKAENAGKETLKGQIMLMPVWFISGASIFGNPLTKGIKSRVARFGVDTGLEIIEEASTEIPQTAMEEAIKKTGSIENTADFVTWENSYKTVLNIIPATLGISGTKSFTIGLKDYALDQYAKAQVDGFIAKQDVADYVKDNKLQYMYNLYEQKGGRFTKQYAAIMYSGGKITEQEFQQLTKKVGDFEAFKSATKKGKLDFADNIVGFTLYNDLQESKSALDAEKDEATKIMLQQNYNKAKAEWESFTKGEGANAVILNMPSGEKFVMSLEEANKMLEDDAVKADIKDGKIGVQVFAKKGQEALMKTTTDKMEVLFQEKKPTLNKFTSPTDEKYGTVNRNDGKGEITLTKEEFLREQGAISGVQKGMEGVPPAQPTEAGTAPTAMGEEGAKAEGFTPEPAASEGTKAEALTKPTEIFDRVDLNEALDGQDLVNNIDETERKFSPEKMKQAGVITDNFDTIMRDMEKSGKIKIDCPPFTKASKGLAIGFVPGGTWEIVEKFTGPSHKEGGIKIEIEGSKISYADADEKVQKVAKNGGFWGTMKNVGLFWADAQLSTLGTLTGSQALSDVISEKQYGSAKWDRAADIAGVAGAVTIAAVAAPVAPGVTVSAGTAAARKTGQISKEMKMEKEQNELDKKQKEADSKVTSAPSRTIVTMGESKTPPSISPNKSDLGNQSSDENTIKPNI